MISILINITAFVQSVHPLSAHKHEDGHATHQLHCQWWSGPWLAKHTPNAAWVRQCCAPVTDTLVAGRRSISCSRLGWGRDCLVATRSGAIKAGVAIAREVAHCRVPGVQERCLVRRWRTSIYCSILRVMRIVTKRLRLGSCSSNYSLAQCRNSLHAKFDYEIRKGSPWSGGSNWGRSVSDFAMLYIGNGVRNSLSNKYLLIGSHIWASIATKVDDLEWLWSSIYCSILRVMRIVTKWLRVGSCSSNYSLAQCRTYLPATFDYKIQMGSPSSVS